MHKSLLFNLTMNISVNLKNSTTETWGKKTTNKPPINKQTLKTNKFPVLDFHSKC